MYFRGGNGRNEYVEVLSTASVGLSFESSSDATSSSVVDVLE